jgi:hypothetical protein
VELVVAEPFEGLGLGEVFLQKKVQNLLQLVALALLELVRALLSAPE